MRIARPVISIIIIIIIFLLNPIPIMPQPKLAATPEAARWTGVNIPAGGAAGGWTLANGSDIQQVTIAADGTIYACVTGLTYSLYKSNDGGLKWSYVGNVQAAIRDIAISPYNTKTIYYATASAVYRSTDGGVSFLQLPVSPGGAGAGNIEITSLTVTWLNNNIIAVGTRDTDGGDFGGVYILDEGEIIPSWMNTNIGSYDICALAFSPDYNTDRQIVAVATDETDTFAFNKIGNADWNAFISSARLNKDNAVIPSAVAAEDAIIAFPGNYHAETASGNSFFFIGINTGTNEGDVYKISCADVPVSSAATDLNCGSGYGEINTDIAGLTIYSDDNYGILIAGAADSNRTYSSLDGGSTWRKGRKEPTGDACTSVLTASDFITSGIIYSATSGNGSALSITRDMGLTWNQISLIDTSVTNIVDFVPSPEAGQINAMFLITFGGEHSLWRSTDDGLSWERILSGYFSGVDSLALINLPPQYGAGCQKIFAAGESNGRTAVWISEDNGQSFQCRVTHAPNTGADFSIDAWVISDENTFYAGSFNGSQGLVYRTTNSGFNYSTGTPAGSNSIYSLALSPNFEEDGTIILGNTDGWVYLSSDNGTSFQPLPYHATVHPLSGDVSVAFDPEFDTNHTVYAASNTADSGIYRFIIGSSEGWENIDATLPAGAVINRLAVSDGGILYAANSDAGDGIERCLNPKLTSAPVFETTSLGLSSGATLSGLWQRSNQLWSLDTTNDKVMTYYDTLISPATQVLPEDEASGIGSLVDHTIRNITIDWETIEGATNYEWQCNYSTDFSVISAGLSGTTSASSVRLPVLEPATTYYWRIRASAPVLSPWSPKWSFTTSMDTEGVNLKPETPTAGAEGVTTKPVFQWTVVLGAEAYELLVATDTDFSHPVIVKTNEYALKTNVWQCDVSLDYETVYYWKVRATTTSTSSAWSSTSIFSTESAPVIEESPPPEEPEFTTSFDDTLMSLTAPANIKSLPSPTPFSPMPTTIISQLPDMPAWVIYLIGGLLGIVFMALLIVLVIILKIKRF